MNSQTDRLMRVMADIGDDLIERAAPDYSKPEASGNVQRITLTKPEKIDEKDIRKYMVLRTVALSAAAVVLLVGLGFLLGTNYMRDWIASYQPPVAGSTAVTTAVPGAMPDMTTAEPTGDRLEQLKNEYPEMFGIETDPESLVGINVAYKNDDNAGMIFTLYDPSALIKMCVQDAQNDTQYAKEYVNSLRYINAEDMKLVLSSYPAGAVKYIEYFDENKQQFETADAETASRVSELLGLSVKAEITVDDNWENPVVKTIDIQEKYISDRLAYEGDGDLYFYNMAVVCGGELYQYVNYGAIPYKRAGELFSSYFRDPSELSEMWNGISDVCEDGNFIPEKAHLLRKIAVYDYFTNEEQTEQDYYLVSDKFLLSVGKSEWGTGLRILRKIENNNNGRYVIGFRKIFELLWKLAEEQPYNYRNMSILFVSDTKDADSGGYGYYIEAVTESDTDGITAYLQNGGADMSLCRVLTVEEERASYLPVEYYGSSHDGSLVKVDKEQGWYGHDYITVGGKVYKGAVHYSDSLDSLLEVLKQNSDEVKEILETTPLNDLLVTPYADVFDPVMMPSRTYDIYHSIYYHIGGYVVEVTAEGYARNWNYDAKATNVREVITSFRVNRDWHDESMGDYVIDHIDFVADDYTGNPRVYARIAADPKYHQVIRQLADLRQFSEFYYEITDIN